MMNLPLRLRYVLCALTTALALINVPLRATAQKLGAISGKKYLMLDRYGLKRIRLPEGSEIYFKLVGEKRKTRDYIGEIWEKDTAVYLVQSKQAVGLNEFRSFHFPRNHIPMLSRQAVFVGSGFLFAAAVADLIPARIYDRGESALIGASFLAISQPIKLFRWKNFKIKPGKSRVRIMNTSWN